MLIEGFFLLPGDNHDRNKQKWRSRGSKGKGKGLGHETTRKGGGEPLQGSHCFCHPTY